MYNWLMLSLEQLFCYLFYISLLLIFFLHMQVKFSMSDEKRRSSKTITFIAVAVVS